MSALADVDKTEAKDGKCLFALMMYGASGRPMEDWRCRPMCIDIFLLGVYLWTKNYDHLTDLSKVCPPNSVQINFYYSTLKGHMRKHRDNGIRGHKGKVHQISTPRSENSQIHGTNVMSFTVGSTMMFSLESFFPGKDGKNCAQMYKRTEGMTIDLDNYSCFLLHPQHDEDLMHSAKFASAVPGQVRISFNFRWCQNQKWFYGNMHPLPSMKHALASHIEMNPEKVQWNFLLRGQERNYDRDEWDMIINKRKRSNQIYFSD